MADRTFTIDGITYNITDHSTGKLSAADVEQVIRNLHKTDAYKEKLTNDLAASGGQDAVIDVHIDKPGENSAAFPDEDGGKAINLSSESFTGGLSNTYEGENGERIQNTVDRTIIHEVEHLYDERIGLEKNVNGDPMPQDGTDSDGDGIINPNMAVNEGDYARQEKSAIEVTNIIGEEIGLTKRAEKHAIADGVNVNGIGGVDGQDDFAAESVRQGQLIDDLVDENGQVGVRDLDGEKEGYNTVPTKNYDPDYDPACDGPDPVLYYGRTPWGRMIEGVADWLQGVLDKIGTMFNPISPLVLDLDGAVLDN